MSSNYNSGKSWFTNVIDSLFKRNDSSKTNPSFTNSSEESNPPKFKKVTFKLSGETDLDEHIRKLAREVFDEDIKLILGKISYVESKASENERTINKRLCKIEEDNNVIRETVSTIATDIDELSKNLNSKAEQWSLSFKEIKEDYGSLLKTQNEEKQERERIVECLKSEITQAGKQIAEIKTELELLKKERYASFEFQLPIFEVKFKKDKGGKMRYVSLEKKDGRRGSKTEDS